MTHTPTEIAAMIERLAEGVAEVGLADDNCTELYDVESANEAMFEAAAMLREVAAERDALAAMAKEIDHERRTLATNLDYAETGREAVEDRALAAEAERDRIAAMVEKLRGYAVHDERCGLNVRLMPRLSVVMTKQCTCGLSEVLKESENG